MNNADSFAWTDERVAELQRMYDGNMTMLQIGAAFGVTRSTISGKLGRLRLRHAPEVAAALKARKPPNGAPSTRTRRRIISNQVMDVQEPIPEPIAPDVFDHDIPLKQRRSLLELTNVTCRWPVGDGPAVWFCGSPTADCDGGSPYCPQHAARAYAPARPAYVSFRG